MRLCYLLRNKSSDPELNLPHSPPPWKEHNTQQPGNVLFAQPGQRGTSSMGRERRRGRWQPGGSRMRCLRSTSWCQGHGKNILHNPYPREVEIRGEQSWIRYGEAAPRASGKAPRGHCGQDEGTEDALSIAQGTSSTGSRAGAALLPPAQSILRFSMEYL